MTKPDPTNASWIMVGLLVSAGSVQPPTTSKFPYARRFYFRFHIRVTCHRHGFSVVVC
jgi:hypothetical protein